MNIYLKHSSALRRAAWAGLLVWLAGVWAAPYTSAAQWSTSKTLSFAHDLGLPPNQDCVVFDYWNQELLGVSHDQVTVEIAGHDTRVLLVHPRADHPRLLGTSRHISGSFSVRDLAWDSANSSLRGTAETVLGAPYTLFIHVPVGMTVLGAQAKTPNSDRVAIHQEQRGRLSSVTFTGLPDLVSWEIQFGK